MKQRWGGGGREEGGDNERCTYYNLHITKQELEEVLLDIAIVLNNQPLMYIEDDIQMPVLITDTLLYGQPIMITER